MRTYDQKKRYGVDGASFRADSEIMEFLCGESPLRMEDTGDYLKSLQNDDGSFKWASDSSNHTMDMTSYAILALKALGCEDRQVFERAEEYLLERRNKDGSFGLFPEDGVGSETLKMTCHALLALRAAGCAEREVFNKARGYVETLKNPDGGFGVEKGAPSDIESTCWALLSLKAAGTPDDEMPDSREYVMSLKNDDGGFGFSKTTRGILYSMRSNDLENTVYAAMCLRTIGPAEQIPEDSKKYLLDGLEKDGCAPMRRTYHAVLGLVAAGDSGLLSRHVDYARKLKLSDGSFRWDSTDDKKGNVTNTFCGVMTLKAACKK